MVRPVVGTVASSIDIMGGRLAGVVYKKGRDKFSHGVAPFVSVVSLLQSVVSACRVLTLFIN